MLKASTVIEAHLVARDRRDEVLIDDNFAMVDVAMAMRWLTSLNLLLLLAMVLPRYVKLSVVATG